jgi:hypothetical protein
MLGLLISTCLLAANPLQSLKAQHPYVLATQNDFARIKMAIATDPEMKKGYERLVQQADKILAQPPSKYEIPDGLRLLATSRRVSDRVATLAMVYRMSGDRRYFDRAWTELKAASEFIDWNPKHFLDTAEMSFAFGIGYDWLYDTLSHEQKTILREAIAKKGITPALVVYKGDGWWAKAKHNWNQVCNGGITVGALAIANEERDLASKCVSYAVESIKRPMKEYGPDGAWAEGPGYWTYATNFNVYFLASLESALGTDFDLSKIKGFSEAGTFPIYACGPFGLSFNYADAHAGKVHSPVLYWLASKFNRPDYAQYEIKAGIDDSLGLLWWDRKLASRKATKPTLDKYYRNSEVVTLRGSIDDSNCTFVAFKAGDNKANHSHLDLGSFVIDALGERWASDLGSDDYNLPAYFGNKRWTYYRLRAEGHNTLVLNPTAKPDQDPKAATKIIRFASKKNRAFAIADLTPAYATSAQSVKRGVALLDRKSVLIQDEIVTDKLTDVWWFLHTAASIELSNDKKTATLTIKGKSITARILDPSVATFDVMDAAPLDESPHPAKQATNKEKKLVIHCQMLGARTIAVLVSPGIAKPPVVTHLDRW